MSRLEIMYVYSECCEQSQKLALVTDCTGELTFGNFR